MLLYTYPGAHRVRFGPGKTFCGIYILYIYIYIYIGVIDTFQTTFLVRQFDFQWTCNLYRKTNKRRGDFSVFCFFREISFVTLLFSTALFKKRLQSWRTRDTNNKRGKETEFKRDASKAFKKDVVVE